MIPHHRYRTRYDVAAMVRKAAHREGAYDTEAIVDYLWQMVDMETGRLDVNVGTFWALYDFNRLDTPQLRATAKVIYHAVEHAGADYMSETYRREDDGCPALRVYVQSKGEDRMISVEAVDVDESAPLFKLYDVMAVMDVSETEDKTEILTSSDAMLTVATLIDQVR